MGCFRKPKTKCEGPYVDGHKPLRTSVGRRFVSVFGGLHPCLQEVGFVQLEGDFYQNGGFSLSWQTKRGLKRIRTLFPTWKLIGFSDLLGWP